MIRVALRAMTGTEDESAEKLFVVFMQLLKLCGAIHNFEGFILGIVIANNTFVM